MLKYASAVFVAIALCIAGSVHAEPRNIEKEAENKQLIIEYYKEPSESNRLKFFSDDYKQHNPMIADGKAGVAEFFAKNEKNFPNKKQTLVRIAADGDLVWTHLHTVPTPGDPGLAVINIFRIDGGKIAEHWDVVQPVPKKSANTNSMF